MSVKKERKNMSYEEKIEIIFSNKLEYNVDNKKAIEQVKIWLGCEWQCGMIEYMHEYTQLLKKVDEIAGRMIQEL